MAPALLLSSAATKDDAADDDPGSRHEGLRHAPLPGDADAASAPPHRQRLLPGTPALFLRRARRKRFTTLGLTCLPQRSACDDPGLVTGTYYIKPNQPGLGAHVCNCGYVVAPNAQGEGIASQMCEHSQAQAMTMGFRAMQFNCVVATNERAIRLWQKPVPVDRHAGEGFRSQHRLGEGRPIGKKQAS
jgi:GNAT superfamily N-acetyltransferase